MDLAKKRHGSEDMHTPIHSSRWLTKERGHLKKAQRKYVN